MKPYSSKDGELFDFDGAEGRPRAASKILGVLKTDFPPAGRMALASAARAIAGEYGRHTAALVLRGLYPEHKFACVDGVQEALNLSRELLIG